MTSTTFAGPSATRPRGQARHPQLGVGDNRDGDEILKANDAWPLMAREAPLMSVSSPTVGTSARASEWSRGGPGRGQGGAARLGTRTFWR